MEMTDKIKCYVYLRGGTVFSLDTDGRLMNFEVGRDMTLKEALTRGEDGLLRGVTTEGTQVFFMISEISAFEIVRGE